MTTIFKPMRAEDKKEEFMQILLSGNGIKKDAGAHDYYDVVPRGEVRTSTCGVGCSNLTRIDAADDILKDVLKSLKKDGYVVMTKMSREFYKGRTKATTYYLAGE